MIKNKLLFIVFSIASTFYASDASWNNWESILNKKDIDPVTGKRIFYRCSPCRGKRFESQWKFNRHYRNAHEYANNFNYISQRGKCKWECKICSKKLVHPTRRHCKSHFGKKNK